MTFKKFDKYSPLLRKVVEKEKIKKIELAEKESTKVLVEVMTAIPMNKKIKEKVEKMISNHIDKEIILDNSASPDIIGGAIIKIGNRVYDVSLKQFLEKMKEKIVEIDLSKKGFFENINVNFLVLKGMSIFKYIKENGGDK